MTESRVSKTMIGLFLVASAVAGCAGSKQDAAVALDGARLTVSDVRKGPAGVNAPAELKVAERYLVSAEQAFKDKDYELTVKESQSAVNQAKSADAMGKKLAAAKKTQPAKAKLEKPVEKPKKKYDKTKSGRKA